MNIDPKLVSSEELFARKELRRRDLAALPIEEKIKMLVKLQHMANAVRHQSGRKYRKPWDVTLPSDETEISP
jgi:hypothetical protein